MNQHSRILVGLDFSPASLAALRQALRIGRWSHASVRAEHIVQPIVVGDGLDPAGVMAAGLDKAMLDDARERWKELVAATPDAKGVHFDTAIDSIVGGLTRRAAAESATLLVVGNSGEWMGRQGEVIGTGPVANGCIRRAHCDALIVREGHDKPYTTVVACIDFSLTSRRALAQAMRTAVQDGARLVVVHAFDPPWKRQRAAKAAQQIVHADAFKDALLARLKAFCETEPHEARFVQPTYALIDVDAHGHGIGAYARSLGADLVVLGKRGHTNLRDLFLGSTAERILREAACSALVVHPVE